MLKNKVTVLFFIMMIFMSSLFAANYTGYKLISSKFNPEIDSTVMIFKHLKSGADVIYLQNTDVEKTFSITFKTPTYDETGVNHILEHSILCGSKNFPVRSSLVALSRSSMNTFLNAFTSSDHTSYPVSSCNEKDFINLMTVYMDGVFNPNLLTNPNIFKQEAWRYELNDEKSPLDIIGVVYNEMKGAFSDPSSTLFYQISRSLFPDTMYKNESGGNPSAIPQLTRERYLEIYKKHYTPSNSIIVLYGKMNLKNILGIIDTKYLSKMTDTKSKIELPLQKPFKTRKTVVAEYPVMSAEDTKNKTYLTYNWVTGMSKDKEATIGLNLLSQLLFGLEASPLKRALIESRVSNSVSGFVYPIGVQPLFIAVAENTNEDQKTKFEKVINDTLKMLAKKGFDKKLIDTLFSSYELGQKASKNSSGRGIGFLEPITSGWMFAGDPTLFLTTDDVMNKIKKEAKNKYFEKLIEKYLLNNNHSSMVILKPVVGLDDKRNEEFKKQIADYKAKLSESQIKDLIKQTNDFRAWQTAGDSPEALASIPTLKLTDISTKLEKPAMKIEEYKNTKILYHNLFTNNVSYIKMYFNSERVPQDKLKYLTLLTSYLGALDTSKLNYGELNNEMYTLSGGISFSPYNYALTGNGNIYHNKLTVSFYSFKENIGKNLNLIDQIINTSKFENKERVKEILMQQKEALETQVISNGDSYIDLIVWGNAVPVGRYTNETTGLAYVNFIKDIANNFDKMYPELVKNLKEVINLVFTRDDLTISFTGNEKDYASFKKDFDPFLKKFSDKKYPENKYDFKNEPTKTAILLPSDVQYVYASGNYEKEGYMYNGQMKVLEKITGDYLWALIREQGGAYGAFTGFTDNGYVYFGSYRDPKLKETFEAYKSIPEFIRTLELSDEELKSYIIGAFSAFNSDFSSLAQAELANKSYFKQIDMKFYDKMAEEMLSTKVEDLRKYADLYEKILNQNIIGVAGNEELLNQNKDLFEVLINPLK